MGKTIVISAVNLRKGGTLSILRECLQELSLLALSGKYRVVALVHRQALADYEGIEYIEIPWSVRSWLHRLWCEYVTMHAISRRIGDIDLWLSLHDTTPRVKARHQAVYCHNSYPFFRWQWRHLWQNYRIVSFALFTNRIYRINLSRNDFIIVQAEWFRDAFARMFSLDKSKIMVFPPNGQMDGISDDNDNLNDNLNLNGDANEKVGVPDKVKTFLYPAYPDVHKNFECLCEATRLMEKEVGAGRFQVVITTDSHSNRYARWLHRQWGDVSSLRFAGFLSREQLYEKYAQADCLVFPSKVETWGLPISEFAPTERPMLLADLPYAHETAAGSHHTAFFNPEQPHELKQQMYRLFCGDTSFLKKLPPVTPQQPFINTWAQLINRITS